MTAHEVDDAARRIGELRSTTLEDAVLAVAAFGLALAASWYRPPLAVPLALGAIVMTVLAGRAFVRRFLLVEELAADGDAYSIPAVHDFGVRAASIEHRRELARILRSVLTGSSGDAARRLAPAAPDLARLIAALESESTHWDPQTVVLLDHWLSDPKGSFRDPAVPGRELRSRVRNILAALGQ